MKGQLGSSRAADSAETIFFSKYFNVLFQVRNQKGKVVEMLKSQESIINELIAREPEKVKKLKNQRNDLLRQQETLQNKLQSSDFNNQKMVNEIEKLKSEVRQEKEEKDEISIRMNDKIDKLKRTISYKDEHVAKQKGILHLTRERNKDLVEEEVRLKEVLAEKDAINCIMKDEIEKLKEKLDEKEKMNVKQEEECQRLKESVSILIADDLKSKAESNQNQKMIHKLQEGLLAQSIQLWSIQQQMVSSSSIVAQTIAQMTIKSAQGVVHAEETFKQIKNEHQVLQHKATTLQDEVDDSQKRINEAQVELHEAEAKVHEAEAIAVERLKDFERELKEAEKKRAIIMDMLQASESAKAELIHVNRKMKEDISVQNEKITEMEIKIQSIVKMLEEEVKRNKALIEEISRVNSQMQTIEEELGKRERKKKSRVGRLSRYFCTA